MIERGGSEGLALKPFASSGIFFHLWREKFQCDMAVQLEVFGFVNHAHPAATKLRDDSIVRNGFADHGYVTIHDIISFQSGLAQIALYTTFDVSESESDAVRALADPASAD
jgi:hypothetical protein